MGASDSNRLSSGRAYADLSSWRKLAVSGEEAWDWLNGLISADVGDLRPGQARESLLLSPTGRIKAAFTVTARPGEAWLLQDRAQPRWVGDLLAPYVLSANVSLRDLTDEASGPLWLERRAGPAVTQIATSARIGVDYAGGAAGWPLRFFDRHSPAVLGRK